MRPEPRTWRQGERDWQAEERLRKIREDFFNRAEASGFTKQEATFMWSEKNKI